MSDKDVQLRYGDAVSIGFPPDSASSSDISGASAATSSRTSNAAPSASPVSTVVPALADGEKGVIIQRDRTTYAVVPHLPCGLVSSAQLRRIADVADEYGCQAIKLTGAQRIALIGLPSHNIDAVWAALDMAPGLATGDGVRSVKACPGTTYCKRGQQDSLAVAQRLDALHHGRKLPAKFKIGVSGCPNQCTETATKDIGLVGFRRGWEIFVGGSGGVNPRLATRLACHLNDEEAIALVGTIIDYYARDAKPKERFFKFIARIGLNELARALGLPEPDTSRAT